MFWLEPARVAEILLIEIARRRGPAMFADEHWVNMRGRWHPLIPEIHTLSPPHECISVVFSDQIAGADVPNLPTIDIGWFAIRRSMLLPYKMPLDIQPPRVIVRLPDREQFCDGGQIVEP